MKVTIWSKENCPACERAKAYCELSGIDFITHTIGLDKTKEDLLTAVPNAKSVPQIFVDEVYVGGYPQFVDFIDKL